MKETKKPDPDRLLTALDVAEWLGVSAATVSDWRTEGTGPQWIKLGQGRSAPIRYRRADVERWIESKRDPRSVA